MINANELRIGNLVFHDRVENTIVGILADKFNMVNILTKQGNVITCNINRIEPIPITEQLLLG